MIDVYNATLDEYCRVALQSTEYYNYLKENQIPIGSDRKALKLQIEATHSWNSKKVIHIVTLLFSKTEMNSGYSI